MNNSHTLRKLHTISSSLIYLASFMVIFSLIYPLVLAFMNLLASNGIYHFIQGIPLLGWLINGVIGLGLSLLVLLLANLPGLILTDKICQHQERTMRDTIFIVALGQLIIFGAWFGWSLISATVLPTGAWLYPLISGGGLLLYRYAHFN